MLHSFRTQTRFFPQPVKPQMLFRVSARLKPCPDKAAEFSTIAARLPFGFAQN